MTWAEDIHAVLTAIRTDQAWRARQAEEPSRNAARRAEYERKLAKHCYKLSWNYVMRDSSAATQKADKEDRDATQGH